MKKENLTPPKFALRLLAWFCRSEYLVDIEGDLIELFHQRIETSGLRKAKMLFWIDVILLFQPGIIHPIIAINPLNYSSMLKNHLKVAVRHLVKERIYSLIHIIGLVFGMTSTIFIFLYVQDEFSYDKFFAEADHIYKMIEERKYPNHTDLNPTVPYAFTHIMTKDYANVESATALSGPYHNQHIYIKNDDNEKIYFTENHVFLVDSNFFSVFSFKMIQGNPNTALHEPNQVVLTESTAKRFFGDKNPLGQFISASGKNSIITGVCEDPPSNSHFKFSYLVSSSSVSWFSQKKFNLGRAHCYFKLQASIKVEEVENKLPELVKNYVRGEITKRDGISWDDFEKSGNGIKYLLKPLTSIHLDTTNLGGMKPSGSITVVRILMAIAVLIFVIASLNFMNLAIARASERSKEVSIRKVMGSFRVQLIIQFLMESFLLSFIGVFLTLSLISLILPYFNAFTQKDLVLNPDWVTIILFIALWLFTGLIGGLYPALILSSFKPITALQGNISTYKQNTWLRNGLVIFQFWISTTLIIVTLIIQKQVRFMSNKNLGFDKEQVMILDGAFHKDPSFTQAFLEEVKNITYVNQAAGSLWVQGFEEASESKFRTNNSREVLSCTRIGIGDHFAETLGLQLLEGQFFSKQTHDSLSVMLNESALKALGIQDPIGKQIIHVTRHNGQTIETRFKIKGIIEDFHYQSLHQQINPLVIQSNEHNFSRMKYIAIKLNAGFSTQTIDQIKAKWQALAPERPFNFRFLDEALNSKYQNEAQILKIFTLFSGLSILISCVGLFTLSSYTVSLRTKEIGIRKVLGASTQNILMLISSGFARIVMVSFLLAVPMGWYMTNVWLQDFAFRVVVSLDIFFFTGIFILLITWLTVSVQSWKAARLNPTTCLRNE